MFDKMTMQLDTSEHDTEDEGVVSERSPLLVLSVRCSDYCAPVSCATLYGQLGMSEPDTEIPVYFQAHTFS